MRKQQAMGVAGLRWLARLWKSLPAGSRRQERQWNEELCEDAIVIVPLLLRMANPAHRSSVIERVRFYEQISAIQDRLATAASFRAMPKVTARTLSAEAQSLWKMLRPVRGVRKAKT